MRRSFSPLGFEAEYNAGFIDPASIQQQLDKRSAQTHENTTSPAPDLPLDKIQGLGYSSG
jgi:hypothetical protein